ncbi:RNA polymerase factor sigma-54 [Acanthopleuribacter pedis]|uniref:RNA polymerase factor sigma-54 n=1 Tax=Acanthopleuribacter pedis TaxID=442870 RepID=A0A8J7U3K1_9BACT|nr:RNA polymerase factor sigma-54 [Acanthopleuribacter pedis]MBO1318433.1 RNA polymerase factor sigma-54 [Acanthopleuribacter pedis]
MALEQRLSLKLSQKLVMTQSLQQAIKLLQMSRLELSDTIQNELLENPVLEDQRDHGEEEQAGAEREGAENADTGMDNHLDNIDMDAYFQEYLTDHQPKNRDREFRDPSDYPQFENMVSSRETLHEHLEHQLGLLPINERGFEIGVEIIGNINDAGRLVAELSEIAELGDWQEEEVTEVWKAIREFDPLGVGARNLRECLEIQLAYSEWSGTELEALLLDHFDLIYKQKYKEIMQIYDIDKETLKEYLEAIKEFDPEPGRAFAPLPPQYIQPDVYIVKVDDEYVIQLNDEGTPRLRVSAHYPKILEQTKGNDKEASDYIKDKFKSAMWLIRSLDQRNRTIYKVAESLVRHQRDFFDKGVEHMKPLVLREVADDIGMHESTVSRVVNNKYVHTPRGVFELKYFFRSGLASANGDDVSSLAVKEKIRKLCSEESPAKPYSDATIVKILTREGIQIARRTVAKYREELGIPSSSKRRKKI